MNAIRPWQLAAVAAALAATVALRLTYPNISAQGLIYIAITAAAAWRFGPGPALTVVLLTLIAGHIQLVIRNPIVLSEPERLLSRAYFTILGAYLFASAVMIALSARHYRSLERLKIELDGQHRRELEASLSRETAARREAEEATRVKQDLVAQLDAELRGARELAAIVESSDDAIVAMDVSGSVTAWNRAAERMFGYTAAEMIGQSIWRIIPPERQAEQDGVLTMVGGEGRVVRFETLGCAKDGTLVPVSLTVSPIRDANGRVVGLSKIARDISERLEGEAAVVDLQRRLLALVSASGVLLESPRVEDVLPASVTVARDLLLADGYAVWRADRDERWSIAASSGISQAFITAPVASPDEGGKPIISDEPLVVENVHASPPLALRRDAYRAEGIESMLVVPVSVANRPTATLAFYWRTKHVFSPLEIQAARALGNLVATALTTAELYDAQSRRRRDVEFLANTATVLGASLDYGRTLAEVAKLAVPHSADWCLIDIGASNEHIERIAVAQVDPTRIDVALHFLEGDVEHGRPSQVVARAIRTAQPLLVRSSDLASAPESDLPYLDEARALGISSFMVIPLVSGGRGIGAMTFVAAESGRSYEPADLQMAQTVAARAALAVDNARAYENARQANQLKDEFLATLSHELRTPLNAILGYARLLRSGVLQGERGARGLEVLERNATSLAQIVEDVLDISRITAGKVRLHVQPVDLVTVIAQAEASVRPAAEAKGVRMHVIVDRQAPTVSGDPDRLQQIVWNLLTNAVKFTPKDGRVQLRLERTNSHVDIVVSDTGRGIDAGFLPHVFERFRQADSRFSREHGGLGLGLAICRDLVQLHGGTIHAASDGPGTGATFSVRLPTTIVHARPPADGRREHPVTSAHVDEPLGRLDGVGVLAVDDEVDALLLLREILESAGAHVTTVDSAQAALEKVTVDRPDVLIADIGMPGMDGFEMIRRLRASPDPDVRQIPAAALTAYARSQDRTRALQAGFQMHLAKPVDPAELVAAIVAFARSADPAV